MASNQTVTGEEISAPRVFADDNARVSAYMCEAADTTQGEQAYWRSVDRQIAEAFPVSHRPGANRGINARNARRASELRQVARELNSETVRAYRAPRGGCDLSRIGGC